MCDEKSGTGIYQMNNTLQKDMYMKIDESVQMEFKFESVLELMRFRNQFYVQYFLKNQDTTNLKVEDFRNMWCPWMKLNETEFEDYLETCYNQGDQEMNGLYACGASYVALWSKME